MRSRGAHHWIWNFGLKIHAQFVGGAPYAGGSDGSDIAYHQWNREFHFSTCGSVGLLPQFVKISFGHEVWYIGGVSRVNSPLHLETAMLSRELSSRIDTWIGYGTVSWLCGAKCRIRYHDCNS